MVLLEEKSGQSVSVGFIFSFMKHVHSKAGDLFQSTGSRTENEKNKLDYVQDEST